MSDMPKRPMLATPTEERTYVRRLKERVRALAAENARLGLVNGDAWRQRAEKAEARVKELEALVDQATDVHAVLIGRAEKAEAELAAALENAVIAGAHDSATCEWCANHFGRAAGRDSGTAVSRTVVQGLEDPRQADVGTPSSAAKSAARHPENQECGT